MFYMIASKEVKKKNNANAENTHTWDGLPQ